jgi:hypothetical protein
MVTIKNLFVDAGADYSTIITVSGYNGQALDLTGYSAASQLRKSYGSSISYNFTASIYNAVEGKISLELTANQASAIPPGRWLYDVEITSPTGKKTRVIEGVVTLNPEITTPDGSAPTNIISLDDVNDIDVVTNGKLDGSVLVYKTATNKWTSTKILNQQIVDGGEYTDGGEI